jgi:rubrerythrin
MGTTLADLQAAFNGESNAQARYVAFARKADADGFGQVASLFRAAAAAEAIHARQHARVIKSQSGTALSDLQPIDIKSTAENLRAAITGECHERDAMYPKFIQQAQSEGNKIAERTFQAALAAEAEHARMYQEALDELGNPTNGTRDYWVCEACGFTYDTVPTAPCPVCKAPPEKLKKVN